MAQRADLSGLHLAKSLPFTDTSIKMSMLSVNGDYGQNGQKHPFVRKNSDVSGPILRTNHREMTVCP